MVVIETIMDMVTAWKIALIHHHRWCINTVTKWCKPILLSVMARSGWLIEKEMSERKVCVKCLSPTRHGLDNHSWRVSKGRLARDEARFWRKCGIGIQLLFTYTQM